MDSTSDRRLGPDRRRRPRGGRRGADPQGFAPLVLAIDEDAEGGGMREAILISARFAVAPARSIDEGLRVMRALRPELVIAHVHDIRRLSEAIIADPVTAEVPLVAVIDDAQQKEGADLADGYVATNATPAMVLEEIRRVMRARVES